MFYLRIRIKPSRFGDGEVDLNRNNDKIRKAAVHALRIADDGRSGLKAGDIDTDTMQVMENDLMHPLVIVQIFTSSPVWLGLDRKNKGKRFVASMVKDVPELKDGKLKVKIVDDEAFSS